MSGESAYTLRCSSDKAFWNSADDGIAAGDFAPALCALCGTCFWGVASRPRAGALLPDSRGIVPAVVWAEFSGVACMILLASLFVCLTETRPRDIGTDFRLLEWSYRQLDGEL